MVRIPYYLKMKSALPPDNESKENIKQFSKQGIAPE